MVSKRYRSEDYHLFIRARVPAGTVKIRSSGRSCKCQTDVNGTHDNVAESKVMGSKASTAEETNTKMCL